MKSIGKEIRAIIKKEGISLYQIAKDLGITWESLYRSLLNGANPEWKTIEKLLDYLGYDFRLVKRKGVKLDMRSTSREYFDNMNKKIHENLQKLFQNSKGEILTARKVKERYKREFTKPGTSAVQASDHIINPPYIKGWHCWCVGTDKAIFGRIKQGIYKVR